MYARVSTLSNYYYTIAINEIEFYIWILEMEQSTTTHARTHVIDCTRTHNSASNQHFRRNSSYVFEMASRKLTEMFEVFQRALYNLRILVNKHKHFSFDGSVSVNVFCTTYCKYGMRTIRDILRQNVYFLLPFRRLSRIGSTTVLTYAKFTANKCHRSISNRFAILMFKCRFVFVQWTEVWN